MHHVTHQINASFTLRSNSKGLAQNTMENANAKHGSRASVCSEAREQKLAVYQTRESPDECHLMRHGSDDLASASAATSRNAPTARPASSPHSLHQSLRAVQSWTRSFFA